VEAEEAEVIEGDQRETTRKLPRFIGVFFFPINPYGLVLGSVFLFVPVISKIICVSLVDMGLPVILVPLMPLLWISRFLLVLIMFWYLSLCVKQSAFGKVRAPAPYDSDNDSLKDTFWQIVRLGCCFIILWSPLIIYLLRPFYPYLLRFLFTWPLDLAVAAFTVGIDMKEIFDFFFIRSESTFFVLVALSAFFFPIGILSAIMFNGLGGLNPILICKSIFSVFFQYLLLVLIFSVFIFLHMFLVRSLFDYTYQFSGYILRALDIYMLFEAAHILGVFYRCNKEKLYWNI